MRAPTWFPALGLLACSAPPLQPSVAPPEPLVQSAGAPPVSVAPTSTASSPGESAAAPAASASNVPGAAAVPPKPLAAVVPHVQVQPITDDYDDRAHEGWPPLVYTGFPAVSEDGAKILLVEERDGFAHTAAFGVRVLDGISGQSTEWYPFGTVRQAPATRPLLVASVPRIEARIRAMETKLAKTAWRALEGNEARPDDQGVWHVRALSIGVSWTAEDEPQPRRLVVTDERTRATLVERDLAGWSRKGVRCAKNDLVLRGVSETSIVFSQHVGPTLHDCDGVVVPTAYRVVSFARP